MAGSVNKVILVGNLGADPEVRRMNSGDPVVNFNLATSESWRDKNSGERMERTEWHRVVIFNEHIAKVAEEYLKKGSKVYIEGQLQTRQWEDQQGQKRYTTEVVLRQYRGELQMLQSQGGRPPAADDPDAYGTTRTRDGGDFGRDAQSDIEERARQQADRMNSGGRASETLDDEIPF